MPPNLLGKERSDATYTDTSLALLSGKKTDQELTEFTEDKLREVVEQEAELGRKLTLKEINDICIGGMKEKAALAGKFVAIATAFVTGADVDAAATAGANAIDNNFVQTAPAFIAAGLTMGSLILSMRDFNDSYKEGGGTDEALNYALRSHVEDQDEFEDSKEKMDDNDESLSERAIKRAVAFGAIMIIAANNVTFKKDHNDNNNERHDSRNHHHNQNNNDNNKGPQAAAGATALTVLGKNIKSYIKDMQRRSGLKIPQKQRDLLAKAAREKKFKKLNQAEKAKHKKEYNSKKKQMKSEWESNTGQKWPKNPKDMKKADGTPHKMAGKEHELHHIIPQQNGGPNTWWNAHPLSGGKHHQGGVHGTGSVLRQMQNKVK